MSELVERIRAFAERAAGVRWTSAVLACEVCGEDAFWDGEGPCIHPNCKPEEEF